MSQLSAHVSLSSQRCGRLLRSGWGCLWVEGGSLVGRGLELWRLGGGSTGLVQECGQDQGRQGGAWGPPGEVPSPTWAQARAGGREEPSSWVCSGRRPWRGALP